jgi:hypothetical protein
MKLSKKEKVVAKLEKLFKYLNGWLTYLYKYQVEFQHIFYTKYLEEEE